MAVDDFLFGSGSKPGILGTGQQKFGQYGKTGSEAQDMRDAYYKNDQYDASRANLNDRQAGIDNRQAPTSQAAQGDLSALYAAQLGQADVRAGTAATIGANERLSNVNIGAVNTSAGLGNANQITATQLNTNDAQFRNAQLGLTNQLYAQTLGKGPSLAANQYQQAAEGNLANQMAAAAAQGGRNSALVGRQAAMNAASQGQQTARDVANIRMQEQMNAQNQLAGVAQTGRSQEIDVAKTNAELNQNANLSNVAAQNDFAKANMQNNQFNAQLMNDRQNQQANMDYQVMLANANATNAYNQNQASLNQQMAMQNAQAFNNAYLQNSNLQAQADMAYAAQRNSQYGQNVQNQQQTNLANQNAYLTNQQQNDAMSQFYQQSIMDENARQQQAEMAYQNAMMQQQMHTNELEQKSYEEARKGQGGVFGSILGTAGGIAGGAMSASDKNVKTSVDRGNAKLQKYLDSLSSSKSKLLESKDNPKNMMSSSPGDEKDTTATTTPAATTQPQTTPIPPPAQGAGFVDPNTSTVPAPPTPEAVNAKKSTAPTDAEENNRRLKEDNERLRQMMSANSQQSGFAGAFSGGLSQGFSIGSLFAERSKTKKDDAVKAKAAKTPENKTYSSAPEDNFRLQQNMMHEQENSPSPNTSIFAPNQQADVVYQPQSNTPDVISGGQNSPNMTSSSSINSKSLTAGIISKAANKDFDFLKPVKPSSAQKMENNSGAPTTFDKINPDGSMDVRGSQANHEAAGVAFAKNPGNTSDYNGMQTSGSGSAPQGVASRVSDENEKKNIKEDDKKISEYLNSIHPYDYSYIDPEKPGRGYGRYVSPMAQEFEKSELGKSAVKETPDGKMVDYSKLLGTMTAADAYLNERLNKLEGKKSDKLISAKSTGNKK